MYSLSNIHAIQNKRIWDFLRRMFVLLDPNDGDLYQLVEGIAGSFGTYLIIVETKKNMFADAALPQLIT